VAGEASGRPWTCRAACAALHVPRPSVAETARSHLRGSFGQRERERERARGRAGLRWRRLVAAVLLDAGMVLRVWLILRRWRLCVLHASPPHAHSSSHTDANASLAHRSAPERAPSPAPAKPAPPPPPTTWAAHAARPGRHPSRGNLDAARGGAQHPHTCVTS